MADENDVNTIDVGTRAVVPKLQVSRHLSTDDEITIQLKQIFVEP